jgi:hypothetical protein
MSEREMLLVRIALTYMMANLDDVCDTFQVENEEESWGNIDFNGEIVDAPTEDELEKVFRFF